LHMGRWMMDLIPPLSRRTAVVVLTASESPEIGANSMRFGARAVVHKRFAIETLMTALAAVKHGFVWMPPRRAESTRQRGNFGCARTHGA
jgi:DNA-binding NarL/FixJ family response regulator